MERLLTLQSEIIVPDVSVVIPVYNVELYLAECLDSVLSQNFQNMEVICVNDGSTDGSADILEEYKKKDKRFRVFSQRHGGLAMARNIGINAAMGKYICFLDSDDMLMPGAVAKLYGAAEAGDLDVLSYETQIEYEDETLRRKDKDEYYSKHHDYYGIRQGKYFFIEMMENGEYIDSACLILVKKEWLTAEKIYFYPGIYYEDVLFTLYCFLKARKMRHLSFKAYVYRVRENSIMTSEVRFDHVYSSIVNFREIMRTLLDMPEKETGLINALVKYMHFIANRIRYLDDNRIDKEELIVMQPIDALLETVFEVGSRRAGPNDELLLSGLEKIVKESGGVVLYGAGEIGKLLLEFLEDRRADRAVICLAVTRPEKNAQTVLNKPVYCIDEIQNSNRYRFILAASRRFQIEMKEKLESIGVDQYIGIDRYTETALRNYARRKQLEKC